MALTRLPSFTLLNTDSYTFGNANVTGNITAGNLKTDHLLYANGDPYAFTTNAAGSNTQVQFNDGNSFAGSANLTFNKTTGTLTSDFFVGNGSQLTGLPAGYTNSNVESYLPTYVGNLNPGNLIVSTSANLGNVADITITGGSDGYILQTDGTGNLQWVDNVPSTTVYTANSIALTNGVFVSGDVSSIQTFGDYAAGNVYVLTDGTGSAPAWYVDIDFIAVSNFNRVVLNINYTQSSGHTIYVQLYNTSTSAWDSIGTYTGLGSYYAFALQVIDSTAYISSGVVQLRLYHSNGGSALHTTSIDYAGLELSNQGPQGPRGSTGPTGPAGNGVATGGTTGQILIKNSATNYDTAWSSSIAIAGNIDADGNAHIGGNLTVIGNIEFTGNGTINQITGNSGQFFGDAQGVGALYAGLVSGYAEVYNPIIQASADANDYVQINFQNINHGTDSSTDFCATSDNGTDTKFFIDMGIAGGSWDGTQDNSLGNALSADDGYLYVQGETNVGNLILGTSSAGTNIKFIAGGPGSGNIRAVINSTGLNVAGTISGVNAHFTGSNISLGNVSHVKIEGGTSGQLLQTDGLGNVNWITPTGTTLTVDNFTANGVQTDFTLSVTPASKIYTMLAIAGVMQPRSVYSLTGNVITFSSAPPNTAPIEVTTFSSVIGYGTSDIVANSFTANVLTANTFNSNTVTSNTLTANTLSGNIVSSNANLSVNTLSANSITNTGTGIPTINSATSINFTASTVVRTTSSPFQFYNCTSTVRDTIAASNGYVIYNTTTNKLQVYANGTWVDLH